MAIIKADTVVLTKDEYEELFNDSLFLNCLRNNGVDNWDWYDEACREYNKLVDESNEGENE